MKKFEKLHQMSKLKTLPYEPIVSVGVLTAPRISVVLHGSYTCAGQSVTGQVDAAQNQDGTAIECLGRVAERFEFKATSPDCYFEIIDVVIGVGFHWERKEVQAFQGNLTFLLEHGALVAVNEVGVETYLASVISSEMSATASKELLKAHAVISRSWLMAQIVKHDRVEASEQKYVAHTETTDERVRWFDREDHVNFHVCADDHCQRYQGITRQTTESVAEAVAETAGLVLEYDGELCDARFSKCCGGVFEEFENCWEPVHHPYLVARRDSEFPEDFPDLRREAEATHWIESSPEAFCNTRNKEILGQVLNNYDQETTDFYRWTVEYTQEELAPLVKERSGIDFGQILNLEPLTRGTSGRISRLLVTGTKRSMVLGKELEIRRSLSPSHLYSSAFTVEKGPDGADGVPSTFTLRGAGWGHGVGLCQIGAAVMGACGYGYDQILTHYFPGAAISRLY